MRSSAFFLLLCAGGCITLETQEDIAAQQAQQQALQQTIDRLKAQTESLLAQQEQLQQQIMTLRAIPQDRVTASDLQNAQMQFQNRLAELERKIAAVDAARSQDMQNVINKVSGLVASQSARISSPAPTRSSSGGTKTSGGTKSGGTTSRSGATSQKAYEHEVAAGDTLSAIASAYKVQPSSIITANNLKDPGHLKVGQKLLIPAP